MSDVNNNNSQELTDRQKKIIENLGDNTYTVAYIEEWINGQYDVFSNAPAALTSMGVHGYLRAINNMVREYGRVQAAQKNDGYDFSQEHLAAFAKAAIEELGLSNKDVIRYIKGGKNKCPECGCLHLYIDRFCPECGELVCYGGKAQ